MQPSLAHSSTFAARRARRALRAGFTLIEVVMATAVVAVAVAGMAQVVTLGSENIDMERKQQVAAEIVAGEVARLRHGAWDVVANLPAAATIDIAADGTISGDATAFALANYSGAPADDDLALSARAGGFRCTLATTRLRPTGASAANVTFVRVEYAVSWTSNTGRPHTRRSEVFLGRNGLHLSYQRT